MRSLLLTKNRVTCGNDFSQGLRPRASEGGLSLSEALRFHFRSFSHNQVREEAYAMSTTTADLPAGTVQPSNGQKCTQKTQPGDIDASRSCLRPCMGLVSNSQECFAPIRHCKGIIPPRGLPRDRNGTKNRRADL